MDLEKRLLTELGLPAEDEALLRLAREVFAAFRVREIGEEEYALALERAKKALDLFSGAVNLGQALTRLQEKAFTEPWASIHWDQPVGEVAVPGTAAWKDLLSRYFSLTLSDLELGKLALSSVSFWSTFISTLGSLIEEKTGFFPEVTRKREPLLSIMMDPDLWWAGSFGDTLLDAYQALLGLAQRSVFLGTGSFTFLGYIDRAVPVFVSDHATHEGKETGALRIQPKGEPERILPLSKLFTHPDSGVSFWVPMNAVVGRFYVQHFGLRPVPVAPEETHPLAVILPAFSEVQMVGETVRGEGLLSVIPGPPVQHGWCGAPLVTGSGELVGIAQWSRYPFSEIKVIHINQAIRALFEATGHKIILDSLR